MLRVSKKAAEIEFVLPSDRSDDGEAGSNPATFIYRPLKKREYVRIVDIMRPEGASETRFTIAEAYDVAGAVLVEARNIEVENEDGTVGPIEIKRGEDGDVLPEIIDLFDPADVFAFAVDVIQRAKIGEAQGEK